MAAHEDRKVAVVMAARGSYTYGGCVGGCDHMGTETVVKWPYWKLVEILKAATVAWGTNRE